MTSGGIATKDNPRARSPEFFGGCGPRHPRARLDEEHRVLNRSLATPVDQSHTFE